SERRPYSFTALAAAAAAICAANGVPLRDPLNPCCPALLQERTFPSMSAMLMIVLLNVAWMCTTPAGTTRFSFFFPAPFFFPPRHAELSFLADGLLLAGDRHTRASPRARVRVRPLAAGRQVPPVPVAPIRSDLDEPADVHLDVLAEVSLDPALVRDDLPDPGHLLLGQILDLRGQIDARLHQDLPGAGPADAVDVCQTNLNSLVLRKIDTRDARHVGTSSALPLLVLLVLADHADDASPADDLALLA